MLRGCFWYLGSLLIFGCGCWSMYSLVLLCCPLCVLWSLVGVGEGRGGGMLKGAIHVYALVRVEFVGVYVVVFGQ